MDYHMMPGVGRIIYIQKMYILRDGFMQFRGYWHEQEENFPLERLFYYNKNVYWIKILEKTQEDMDTSGGFYDEDVGGHVCLFPMYRVTLKFITLAKNPPQEQMTQIILDIKEDDALLTERRHAED
jgi:hypothetical protein